ncbi:MAG: hypothetical protein Q4A56_06955 [Porphyromonadaceae bacterium]|nr:hypothetical protein [Porphyromonadaceae bacterium]
MSNRGIHRHFGSYAAEALSSLYGRFTGIYPPPQIVDSKRFTPYFDSSKYIAAPQPNGCVALFLYNK